MTATDVSPAVGTIIDRAINVVLPANTTFDAGLAIMGSAVDTHVIVREGWSQAKIYAADALNSAENYLTSLANAANAIASIPSIDPNVVAIDAAVTALTALAATPPSPPVPSITFSDTVYASSELSHLVTQLDTWVTGVTPSGESVFTGLPVLVEQALWDRARAREVVSSGKKSQEALRQFAARGFSKPPGALAVQLMDVAQETQNNDSTVSRDVAIKQADLVQSNRRFAFEQASKIQEMLATQLSNRMQRAAENGRALCAAIVNLYGHTAQIFTAQASANGALIGAQSQLYRGQVDLAIGKGNLQVEIAKSNVQALIQKATVLVESIRAAAQISGQLAASALSAVNISAGLHDSTSTGVSVSDARSRSVSVSAGAQSNRQENFTP